MLCVVCPHCHQMMTAPVDAVGESVACPSCKKNLQVPPNAPHLPKHLQPGGGVSPAAAGHAKAAAGGGGVAAAVAAPPVPGCAAPGMATTPPRARSTLPIGILVGAAVLGVLVVAAVLIIPKLGGKKTQVISSTKKTPVIPSDDPTPPDTIQPGDLTAALLYKAYFDNLIAADESYKDKTVTLSGKVVAVGGQGEPFVNLYGIDRARDLTKLVRCYFHSNDKDRLKALVPNQVIHVKGTCKGMTDGRVVIRDCNFVAE